MFSNVIFLVLIFNFTCYTLVDHIETRGEKINEKCTFSNILKHNLPQVEILDSCYRIHQRRFSHFLDSMDDGMGEICRKCCNIINAFRWNCIFSLIIINVLNLMEEKPFCLQKPRTSHHGELITTNITVTLAWNHFLLSKHSVKASKIVLTLEKYFSIIVCKVPCARHQSILGLAPGPSSRSRLLSVRRNPSYGPHQHSHPPHPRAGSVLG